MTSAKHEEAAADEQRERQHDPVARAEREPDRVRDDDPDEADQPADRDGGRRADRREDDDREPRRGGRSTPRVAASSSPTLSTSSTRRWSRITTDADDDVRRDERDVVPARRCRGCRGSSCRPPAATAECCCWTNVWTAVRNATTVTPARIERRRAAGRRRPSGRARRRATTPSARAERTRRAGAGRSETAPWPRRRSRSSRRARRRRRRRAGTGRRAGCGRRPGTTPPASASIPPTSRPSTTRGARSCQRIARVRRREVRVDVRGTAGARAPIADDRADADVRPGPTSEADEHARRRGTRRRARTGTSARGGEGTRTASPSPTATSRRCDHFADARLRTLAATALHEVDDPRPPARGDVVAHRDDAAVLDRRDRAPARPRRRPSPRSGRSTSCRRGRSGRGSPRRCTRPRASGSRSRVLSAASAMFFRPSSV